MPLNRNRQFEDEQSKSVADYAASKQQSRSQGALDLVDGVRPATPQDGHDSRSRSQTRQEATDHAGNLPNGGRKHVLDAIADSGPGKFSGFKMRVPDTRKPLKTNSQQPALITHGRSQSKPRQQFDSTKPEKPKDTQKPSVFDDTTSLDQSMFDDSGINDNPTVVYKPQQSKRQPPPLPPPLPPTLPEPQPRATDSYREQVDGNENFMYEDFVGNYDTQDVINGLGYTNDWQAEADAEREYQAQKQGHTPDLKAGTNPFESQSLRHNGVSGRSSVDLPEQPETPSRVQSRSVPPANGKVHAPAPHRVVGFANSPQIFNMSESPAFRSEDLARENSPGTNVSRPNSVDTVPQTMAYHHKPQQMMRPPSRNRQPQKPPSATTQATRDQRMEDVRSRLHQPEQKISARDSDLQDSSEDELDPTQPEVPQTPSKHIDITQVVGKKRSFEDTNILDYDQVVLTKKTLSELQKEPFTVNPRTPSPVPARDNHGNEMTLSQILDNLKKITPEQQKETFRTQTDEQWTQTGQWFVEQFQADLRELMEIRLERRRIALRYEDQIRRRQRAVEYQQAGVEKQLKELQEGGNGLLKDRPVAGGSRTGTPMRPARE